MARKPKNNAPFCVMRDGYFAKADESGESGEITMYGDVVSERPYDWDTGERDKGNFIVESEILADLKELSKCKRLDIKLNSVGGEVCTAIVIHNKLREMAKNGTQITCTVDGVAMSAGSHIMCAADKVRASEGSLIMIHKAMRLLFGFYNADKLRKLATENDAFDKAILAAYRRKTGKSDDELLSLMSDETYMTGKEAIEFGFVDELIETEEKADIAATADRSALVVNGRLMRLYGAPCPESVPVEADPLDLYSEIEKGEMIAALGETAARNRAREEARVAKCLLNPKGDDLAAVNDIVVDQVMANTEKPLSGGFSDANNQAKNNKGGKPMANNLSELRAENPELATNIVAELKAGFAEESKTATDEAVKAALADERERLAKIDKLSGQVSPEMLEKAKYGEPCSAEELAYKAMLENAKNGANFMEAHQNGYEASGAADVGACAAPDDNADAQFEQMTDEQKKEFAKSEIAKLLGKDGN